MTHIVRPKSVLRLAIFTALALASRSVAAGDWPSLAVVKVEETWELAVGEPNAERNAPQVTMAMSPFGHAEDKHFVLTLNHRSFPDYSAGGLQVQDWVGESPVDYRNGPQDVDLQYEDEIVRWTQSLTMSGNSVVFEVTNGTSQTWGNFGGQGYLRSTVDIGQDNLNTYSPYVSIAKSGIDYAGNRVVSLTLQRVRWTLSDGRVFELTAPIDIDSDLDPWQD